MPVVWLHLESGTRRVYNKEIKVLPAHPLLAVPEDPLLLRTGGQKRVCAL